jgi:hypothetical protein
MENLVSKEQALDLMYNQTDDEFYLNSGNDVEVFEILKISKDLKTTIKNIDHISRAEIRTLVSLFYQVQEIRIATREQLRSIEQNRSNKDSKNKDANVAILDYIVTNFVVLEKNINKILEMVVETRPEGRWLTQIKGIGAVLAAGLIGYLDITDKQYSSQFISYAGLNDNNRPWLGREKSKKIVNDIVGDAKTITDEMVEQIAIKSGWSYGYLAGKAYDEKKKKWNKESIIKACSLIPYNKDLKKHMYKIGKQFLWLKNDPESLYGRLLSERIVYEMEKNENGDYADQAAKVLETKNISNAEHKKCYQSGKLPKSHITMRAFRYVEKIFISHLFEEMYRVANDEIPPRYYALEHLEGQHNKEILPEVPYDLVSSEMKH